MFLQVDDFNNMTHERDQCFKTPTNTTWIEANVGGVGQVVSMLPSFPTIPVPIPLKRKIFVLKGTKVNKKSPCMAYFKNAIWFNFR